MRRNSIGIFGVIAIVIIVWGCDDDTIVYDKQIRLEIDGSISNSSSEWLNTQYETYTLINFNKHNYIGVDSIVFFGSLYTSDVNNTVYLELYNMTDSTPIQNTTLTSNINDYIFMSTDNIYDYLPDHEINLGLRVRSQNEGIGVSSGARSYLFLYRD